MKFVKLLRPLFIVALGLHALALFLPLGGASETAEVEVVEEEAPLEELPSTSPGTLPVPDLNATTNEPASAGSAANGIVKSVLSPAAVSSPAPAAPSSAATRSAPAAANVPNAGASRTIPPSVPSAASPPTAPTPPAANDPVNSSPPLALPELDAAIAEPIASNASSSSASEIETPDGENSQATESSAPTEAGDRDLIASAPNKVIESLKALMNRWAIALNYNPKGTDDSSAQAARAKWTDKISSQASRSSVGSLEPESIEDFMRVNYPIEASARDSEQAFRVCLEQPPGPAEVGVLFDSQGEIVGEPELIRSTGYQAVNREAIAQVESAEALPTNRRSKAFVLEVPIDYDKQACVKLSDLK